MDPRRADQLTRSYEKALGMAGLGGTDPIGDDPQWSKSRKCHDWRNHVPEEIQKAWPLLDRTARMAIFIMAEDEAEDEYWE